VRGQKSVRAKTVDDAFSLYGVSLGASSGWSKYVETSIANRGTHPLYICGLAADGTETTYDDGAALYAGPFQSR
jgi:hypothetical protein